MRRNILTVLLGATLCFIPLAGTTAAGQSDCTITGTDDDDRLRGTNGPGDRIRGSGDDELDGDRGNDIISGGRGDDDVQGSEGIDLLSAGRDDDLLSGGWDYSVDEVDGEGGHDTCTAIGRTQRDRLHSCEEKEK